MVSRGIGSTSTSGTGISGIIGNNSSVNMDSLQDHLVSFVEGGYSSPKKAVNDAEFEYIRHNMEETSQTLYRVEDASFTANNLSVGQEFSFRDDLRSFTRSSAYSRELLGNYIDMGMDTNTPMLFKTVGSVKHFNMDKYAEIALGMGTQSESLAGGRFRVRRISQTPMYGRQIKVVEIEQL